MQLGTHAANEEISESGQLTQQYYRSQFGTAIRLRKPRYYNLPFRDHWHPSPYRGSPASE